jgi:hypothetical protein
MSISKPRPPSRLGGARVRFVEAGGIAGVRRICEVPLAEIPSAARRGLKRVFAVPSKAPGPGRDLKTYRLTLASDQGFREILFDEATAPPAARPLLRYLSKRAVPGWV